MKKSEKERESETKIWFIIIENQQLGPYNLVDLKKEPAFTPDTLVWRKGFSEWIKARFVSELKSVFKDDLKPPVIQDLSETEGIEGDLQQSQAILTLQQDPYQFILWILVFVLVACYTFYRIYYQI